MPSLPWSGSCDAALVVAVEPGDDAQQRGLAAARRADQRADLAAREAERQTGRARAAAPPEAAAKATCA